MWRRSVPAPLLTQENHRGQMRLKDVVGSLRRPGSAAIFRKWSRSGRAVAQFEAADAHGGYGRLDVPKGTQSRRSAKGSLLKPHRAHSQSRARRGDPWSHPMGSLVAHRGVDILIIQKAPTARTVHSTLDDVPVLCPRLGAAAPSTRGSTHVAGSSSVSAPAPTVPC